MTTVVLNPNGDVVSINITATGAGISAGQADASDATYIEATSGTVASQARVELETVAIPAGAVTESVTVNVRANSAVNYTATAQLITRFGVLLAEVSATTTAAATNYTGAAVAVTLSQADVDGWQLDLKPSAGTAGTDTSRIHKSWVSLTYATQPVCVATAPTGVISTTTTPTVSWSHTAGSDGGGQARYQAAVFSAAQYGVSGFNPASSPSTWSSGEVVGSATSTASGVVANTSTYRAYVRTAQTVNGVSHWSEWAYSAFTTSFTTPNITSVAATGDNTFARNRLTVTRDAATPLWNTLDVECSTDAGVTWALIRGGNDILPPGNVWIGYDYEAPNGVAALYRARATSVGSITGPYATSTAATWTSSEHWLKDLRTPARSQTVEISELPQRKWGIDQGVHHVVGRAAPVVTSDVRQHHEADITFEVYTRAAATAVYDALTGATLLLQIAAGAGYDNIYLRPGTVSEARGADLLATEWRYITVGYVEVAAPVDDGVAAFGLTYTDVNATYATYALLRDGVASYGALV